MSVIVVAGDSWSSSQIGWCLADWQGPYRSDLSVANQLRRFDHTVYELATPGASIGQQLDSLADVSRQYPSTAQGIDCVVMGWTEWSRDANLIRNADFYSSIKLGCMNTDYDQAGAETAVHVTQKFRMLTKVMRRTQWLHWGAMAQPWIDLDCLGSRHRVIYQDYCALTLGLTPRTSNLVTFAPRHTSPKHIAGWINTVFPGTPKSTIKHAAENVISVTRDTATSGYFSDGGHLNFEYYTPLINSVNHSL